MFLCTLALSGCSSASSGSAGDAHDSGSAVASSPTHEPSSTSSADELRLRAGWVYSDRGDAIVLVEIPPRADLEQQDDDTNGYQSPNGSELELYIYANLSEAIGDGCTGDWQLCVEDQLVTSDSLDSRITVVDGPRIGADTQGVNVESGGCPSG